MADGEILVPWACLGFLLGPTMQAVAGRIRRQDATRAASPRAAGRRRCSAAPTTPPEPASSCSASSPGSDGPSVVSEVLSADGATMREVHVGTDESRDLLVHATTPTDDGELVRGALVDPVDRLVVASVVSLARGVGGRVAAGPVADEETAALLRDLGVDLGQGACLGSPRPWSEFVAELRGPRIERARADLE